MGKITAKALHLYTVHMMRVKPMIRKSTQAVQIAHVTVGTNAAAKAVPEIRDRLAAMGCDVPLVGDFHFNGHKLLKAEPACAEALAKYRINPGNVGRGKRKDEQFSTMIEIACRNNKPVRIGANWGSLDQDLLARLLDENAASTSPMPLELINRNAVIESALSSAARAEEIGLDASSISFAPGLNRSGHGFEGDSRIDRRIEHSAATRHW